MLKHPFWQHWMRNSVDWLLSTDTDWLESNIFSILSTYQSLSAHIPKGESSIERLREWKQNVPKNQNNNKPRSNKHDNCLNRKRVILHFDIDCFYAQVEMLKDPTLKPKKVFAPLAKMSSIWQKSTKNFLIFFYFKKY